MTNHANAIANGACMFCFFAGQIWGWMVGESRGANGEIARPYICEISKAEVYKIIEDEKGYGKVSALTSAECVLLCHAAVACVSRLDVVVDVRVVKRVDRYNHSLVLQSMALQRRMPANSRRGPYSSRSPTACCLIDKPTTSF